MFTERKLNKFLADFPEVRLKVESTRDGDGNVVLDARLIEGETVVASCTAGDLLEVPCALAESFRKGLAKAAEAEDEEALSEPQRTALSKGIPGIANARRPKARPKAAKEHPAVAEIGDPGRPG